MLMWFLIYLLSTLSQMLLFSSSHTLWFWTFYCGLDYQYFLHLVGHHSPLGQSENREKWMKMTSLRQWFIYFSWKRNPVMPCAEHMMSLISFSMLLIPHSPFSSSWKLELQKEHGGDKTWALPSLILLPQKIPASKFILTLQLVKWLTGTTGQGLQTSTEDVALYKVVGICSRKIFWL